MLHLHPFSRSTTTTTKKSSGRGYMRLLYDKNRSAIYIFSNYAGKYWQFEMMPLHIPTILCTLTTTYEEYASLSCLIFYVIFKVIPEEGLRFIEESAALFWQPKILRRELCESDL